MNTMLADLKKEAVTNKDSLLKTMLLKTSEKWKDIKTVRGIERFVEDVAYQIKAKERSIEDLEDQKVNSAKDADFTSTENRLKFLKTVDDLDTRIEDLHDAIARLKRFQKEYL